MAHALSNTVIALGQGFALAMALCARCQLVCACCQCMMLVEGVAHASLKTFGHFALSCGCGVASRPLSLIGVPNNSARKPRTCSVVIQISCRSESSNISLVNIFYFGQAGLNKVFICEIKPKSHRFLP